MRTFDQQSRGSLAMKAPRLETPTMVGYRVGMSCEGVIGRKLSSIFGVDRDLPGEMNRAINVLHDRLGR